MHNVVSKLRFSLIKRHLDRGTSHIRKHTSIVV